MSEPEKKKREPFLGIREGGPCVVSLVVGAFLMLIILLTMWTRTEKSFQSKAVELGAAEWQVDQSNGETKFVWKEKK